MPTLTKKQKEIFDFINSYYTKHGVTPTFEEIGARLKRAVGTIHEHVEELVKKGFIKKTNNSVRGIEVIKPTNTMTTLSLMGLIAAGGPIEAIRNPELIDVPTSMLSRNANYYALKVAGTSMIEEGISDGDIIIVREQSTIEDGEKAVAYLPDKDAVTLKKIYRENNRIKLVPANKTMKPFYEKNVEIQGKVTGVIRKEV